MGRFFTLTFPEVTVIGAVALGSVVMMAKKPDFWGELR